MIRISIRAGQILHAANTFIVDRLQTAGATLNIPQERIYELGNYQSVAVVRDVPDLTFSLDALDVSCEIEGILTGSATPESDASGTVYDLSINKILDIISPWKSAQGAFNVVRGVAIPQLTLESVSYRYGLKQNAGETYTLRGDTLFYIPGTPYNESFTGDGVTTVYAFAHTALKYTQQGNSVYALNVSVDGIRQTHGTDYTDTTTNFTFAVAPATGAKIRVVYGSSTSATYGQAVNADLTVKPAAIRGQDIKVYVGLDGSSDPLFWSDVQSFNLDWRLTLEDTFEFGSPYAVSRDATTAPDVTGSIEVKSSTIQHLFDKLNQITGVTTGDIVGPDSSVALPLRVELLNPASGGTSSVAAGSVLKTILVPDARFTVPGYTGNANQLLTSTVDFQSDSGSLSVGKGTLP